MNNNGNPGQTKESNPTIPSIPAEWISGEIFLAEYMSEMHDGSFMVVKIYNSVGLDVSPVQVGGHIDIKPSKMFIRVSTNRSGEINLMFVSRLIQFGELKDESVRAIGGGEFKKEGGSFILNTEAILLLGTVRIDINQSRFDEMNKLGGKCTAVVRHELYLDGKFTTALAVAYGLSGEMIQHAPTAVPTSGTL